MKGSESRPQAKLSSNFCSSHLPAVMQLEKTNRVSICWDQIPFNKSIVEFVCIKCFTLSAVQSTVLDVLSDPWVETICFLDFKVICGN